MVTRMFKDQIGKSIEVYIDDMVVKMKGIEGHTSNMAEVLDVLRQHKLHLNAKKCSFGVGFGKFLGYMITTQGIEVNLDQITTTQQLQPPNNLKEIQKLTEMIATLNRVVSRSADRCRPFYQLLKK